MVYGVEFDLEKGRVKVYKGLEKWDKRSEANVLEYEFAPKRNLIERHLGNLVGKNNVCMERRSGDGEMVSHGRLEVDKGGLTLHAYNKQLGSEDILHPVDEIVQGKLKRSKWISVSLYEEYPVS